MLAAGAEPVLLGIARDELDETRRLIAAALEHDVVLTSGGVSVGEFDFVKQVQEELGVERRFWGVATKPGKPLAFGVRGGTLVFGVPGNPVAAMVSFELYIRPALLAMQGRPDLYRPYIFASAEEPVAAHQGAGGGAPVPAARTAVAPGSFTHHRAAGLRHPSLDGSRGRPCGDPRRPSGGRAGRGAPRHPPRRRGARSARRTPARRSRPQGVTDELAATAFLSGVSFLSCAQTIMPVAGAVHAACRS